MGSDPSNNYYKEIINGEILIGKKKYVIDPDDRYKQNKFLYKIANKENNRYYFTAVNVVSDGEFMQFKGSDKRCYFVIKKIYRADALTNEEDISAAHRLFYKSEPIPKI